jgi:signal transduction histidine kinase
MCPVPDVLLSLAPTDLPTLRVARFDGTGCEVPLARFAPDDREILTRLYAAVKEVHALRLSGGPVAASLEQLVVAAADGRLMAAASALGEATRSAGRATPEVYRALHDVRGGGLTVFLGAADLLAAAPGDRGLLRMAADAARDHAKIMRNLLPDIDPAGRAADEAAKPHGIDHFTTKWAGARVGPAATVAVRCVFAGDVSARCLETASVDRVVYNYVNNAARFSADGAVTLWVVPAGDGLSRWVVQNAIAPDQAAFLAERVGGDLGRLFRGGITRGGTGIGLANCADVVADCFGLEGPAEALQSGYLGAALRGPDFYAWFHWPALAHPPQG